MKATQRCTARLRAAACCGVHSADSGGPPLLAGRAPRQPPGEACLRSPLTSLRVHRCWFVAIVCIPGEAG